MKSQVAGRLSTCDCRLATVDSDDLRLTAVDLRLATPMAAPASLDPRVLHPTLCVLITLGILSAGLGLKGFLLPSGFIDGGVTGVSLLLATVTACRWRSGCRVINVPFVARRLPPARRARSRCAARSRSARSPVVLALVQYPDVTPGSPADAVFGGFFLGAGIGLAVRGGAVLDGTEIAALLISKRSTLLRVGDVILGFNVVLFLIAMAVLGVEAALYSILTYLDRGADARLRHPRHRGVHGDDDRVEPQRADPRRASPASCGRGVTVYGARRPDRRRAGHPLLRRHAPGDRQGQGDRARHRRARVHRVARAVGRRRRRRQEDGARTLTYKVPRLNARSSERASRCAGRAPATSARRPRRSRRRPS